MNTKIKDLSLEELKDFIDQTVDKRLEERLGDPDYRGDNSIYPLILRQVNSTINIFAMADFDYIDC